MDKPRLFNESNSISRNAATIFLNKYASKFKWNKFGGSVIDLGCGDGSVTSILRRFVPSNYQKFYACDINQTMLDYATEHFGHENIKFILQNVQGDLSDELRSAFDNVFSFFLFHWIYDQEKGFQNIYDLMKPGGECFIMFFAYLQIYEPYGILAPTPKWSGWLKDINNFISAYQNVQDPESMVRRLMENIGFSNISIETKKMTHTNKNAAEHKKLLRAVDPHNMPDDVFEDFYKDYFKVGQDIGLIHKDDTIDGNREVIFKFTLIVIHAGKPEGVSQ